MDFKSLTGRTVIATRMTMLLLCFLLAVPHAVSAQPEQVSVKGVVRDQNGGPIAGVTVVIKSKNTGTTTNATGEYAINVNRGETLVFTLIGYDKVEQEIVAARTVYDVVLKDVAYTINDVIAIGYGQTSWKDLTGTVVSIGQAELLKAPVVNIDQALQGRLAGVVISSSDGQPGIDTDIVIRGANSLTQDNSPLYVVDGFPIEEFSLSTIDANDIESINVLKDASATAIYGSRGANGVVIIETKQGQIGKPKVSYSGTYGVQQVTKTMDLMNAYEYVRYQLELSPASATQKYLTNEGRTHEDYRNIPVINWQDQLFQIAPVQKHNITISGGTNETRYSISFSATDQDGVITNSGYQKYQGRLALTQQLYKNLSMKLSLSNTEDKRTGQTSSASLGSTTGYSTYLMYRTWAFRPIQLNNYTFDEELDDDSDDGDLEYATLFDGTILNPIVSNNNEYKVTERNTLMASNQLTWKVMDGLTLNILGGINRKTTNAEAFYNSLTYMGRMRASNSDGINASHRTTSLRNWVNENTLTYARQLNPNHKFDALVGFTMQSDETKAYGFRTTQIPKEQMGMPGMDDGVPVDPYAVYRKSTLMSYLGRVNYNIKSRYMFTATFRADGSSKFDKGNRWAYFPSGAFAWRFSEELFMMPLRFVNDAKLRLSWGMTGNNRIDENSRYAYLSMSDWYSFNNGSPNPAYGIAGIGNRDLKWETTEQLDAGLDLALFKNKIRLSVDFYRKVTRDLLFNARISSTPGVSSVYKNIGKVRNSGLEFSVKTTNIRTHAFQWTSDFNISFNRSRILALSDDQDYMASPISWTGNFNSTPLYLSQVGGPLTAFYGFVWEGNYQVEDFDISDSGAYSLKNGIPSNGSDRTAIQPGHIRFRDIDGDGEITERDRVVIGRAEPLHTGGFNNIFRYSNFELSVFLQWSYGYQVMNANRIMFEGNQSGRPVNQFASYTDRYVLGDESTYGSKNHAVGGGGPLGYYSTKTLEDGSYLRLKTLQLSYNFPTKAISKIGLTNLQVFISGQNLFILTSYTGLDPEVSTRHTALTPGFDYSSYARNKIYTCGLKVTF